MQVVVPDGTLIMIAGTWHPHAGPSFYKLTKLYLCSRRGKIQGEIFLKGASFVGDGKDIMAEKTLVQVTKYFLRKRFRPKSLSFSTESKRGKVKCIFSFQPAMRWRTSTGRKKFIYQIKRLIFNRICGYDRY
jgi:hypothetical protein